MRMSGLYGEFYDQCDNQKSKTTHKMLVLAIITKKGVGTCALLACTELILGIEGWYAGLRLY